MAFDYSNTFLSEYQNTYFVHDKLQKKMKFEINSITFQEMSWFAQIIS